MEGRIAGLDSLEGIQEPGDLVFRVLRRECYSEAGLILGNGRVANCRHEESFFFELRGSLKAAGLGSQTIRHNWRKRRFREAQSAAQLAHSLPEARVSFSAERGSDDLDSGDCRRRRRRWGSGGENEGSGLVEEEVDKGLRATDEASGGANSLPQSTHVNVDSLAGLRLLGQSLPASAKDAGGVGFVDHKPGFVMVFERGDFGQRRLVAFHREDAFGHD